MARRFTGSQLPRRLPDMPQPTDSSLSLGLRLGYGAGGAVYAIKEAAYTMFILLFYTQVLGLSGALTGLAIALGLVWDAVSDPLVGALSDRLRHSRGRRHPFLALSILPMGIGYIGLFWPPAAIIDSQWLLGGWLLFWSLWVRTFVTTFSIPHLAMATDITSDYAGRSRILGARLAFTFLFTVLMPAGALLFIFTDSGGVDGRFERENYVFYGLLSCVICVLMATITTIRTRRFARSSLVREDVPDRAGSLTGDLLRTLRNRSFRILLGADVSMMLAFGCVATLNMLMWTYFWEFDAREVSIILSVPSLLAVAAMALTLGPLGRRYEKYQLLQLALVGLILNCLWLYPLRLFGLLPPNGHPLVFWLNFLLMALFMYFFLMRSIQNQSIIADVTDEHDLEHGLRQEAGFFAANNFASKSAAAFGPFYGGIALDVVGLTADMRPGTVPEPVLDKLVLAYGLGAIPFMVLALLFSLKIVLSRVRVEEIQAALRERGEAATL
jgi:GPH family glycoside/pentoside/hexuronide:cation symporter